MTPRYHVILSPRAAGDLHAVHTFVERDSPQNAASLIGELVDAIDSLQFQSGARFTRRAGRHFSFVNVIGRPARFRIISLLAASNSKVTFPPKS